MPKKNFTLLLMSCMSTLQRLQDCNVMLNLLLHLKQPKARDDEKKIPPCATYKPAVLKQEIVKTNNLDLFLGFAVGTVIGEHGTATVLLVLDNVIVIAVDLRISSITNWIVKPYWFKVRKIRENLASVAYYNENKVGAENRFDHLEDKGKKTCSHKSLIRATSKFMKNNVPWESFGGHLDRF
ncbi:hypothetical protein C1H46_034581 [Malus baccata]|uniref:Uncharacterized protein n=1 Tax=Malus baccata TaxID=106549 RepID=A0A540L057_MALBA|nr:hypothetical protein C1H46_034581 [Malus baccata]